MRFLFALCVLISPAFAQSDPVTSARRASQMLNSAGSKLSEANQASDRVAALTDTVRAYEEGLSAVREGIRRAAIRQTAIEQNFEAKRDRLSRLLGVLQTIEKSPTPLFLMHPAGPLGTARSGMVLSDVAPALQAEAETLRAQLTEVVDMRNLQKTAEVELRKALIDVQDARVQLADAVANRTELPTAFLNNPESINRLLDTTETLESFANGLAAMNIERTSNPADFETARGKMVLPVTGTFLTKYNETGADGIKRPGLKIATTALSIVTTPWPATVRFSGDLLEQGTVVILEPGTGHLMILAGIGTSYVKEGEILAKGAPVGIMGGLPQNADAFLINARQGSGGNQQESLYIELRQGGTPVDPEQWFTVKRE
jgi:septal ring factor EnvC (AmiA/AmiB activator)